MLHPRPLRAWLLAPLLAGCAGGTVPPAPEAPFATGLLVCEELLDGRSDAPPGSRIRILRPDLSTVRTLQLDATAENPRASGPDRFLALVRDRRILDGSPEATARFYLESEVAEFDLSGRRLGSIRPSRIEGLETLKLETAFPLPGGGILLGGKTKTINEIFQELRREGVTPNHDPEAFFKEHNARIEQARTIVAEIDRRERLLRKREIPGGCFRLQGPAKDGFLLVKPMTSGPASKSGWDPSNVGTLQEMGWDDLPPRRSLPLPFPLLCGNILSMDDGTLLISGDYSQGKAAKQGRVFELDPAWHIRREIRHPCPGSVHLLPNGNLLVGGG